VSLSLLRRQLSGACRSVRRGPAGPFSLRTVHWTVLRALEPLRTVHWTVLRALEPLRTVHWTVLQALEPIAMGSLGWHALCLPIAMGRCPEGAVGHLVLRDAEL